jgi:tetratricopeptide (TPR) repeat protein/predicted Ser/Thr protein kinase
VAESSTYNLTSSETLDRELEGYRVTRQIGHGAMGVVFEAVQKSLGRRVAIKVLPTSLALRKRTVKRFLREAEAMGRLSHENIVAVYDVGSIRNLHYFSMEYVEGPPLDRVLKAGPVAIADAVQIGLDVAQALAHAHAQGVLHRDIKPGNLLRDRDKVVLTDFGLARPLDAEETGTMTESGDLVGTPLYMAPEQISGDAERTDGRADVWGLGVTLYELLTQRPPFTGPNAQGILNSILHKDPPLLRKVRDDVPRDLEAVILKCLEKDPARRYSGAAALVEDLQAVRDGRSVTASTPRFYDPAVRWGRRHPVELTVVGIALLVSTVLGVKAQQIASLLTIEQGKVSVAEGEREAAQELRDLALDARTVSRVRYELSEARILWTQGRANGEEAACIEAKERVGALVDSLTRDVESYERNLDLSAECMTVLAGWIGEQEGGAEGVLAYVDSLAGDVLDPNLTRRERDRLQERNRVMRAAALTGIEHFDQALAIHRARSVSHPRDPAPFIDSARIMRQRGYAAARDGRPNELMGRATQALQILGDAIELAFLAEDTESIITIYVERARCLIDLGQLDSAIVDLTDALDRDPNRVEASSLLTLAINRKEAAAKPAPSPPGPRVAGPSPATPVEAASTTDDASGLLGLGDLIPGTPALKPSDLESAGRGLQSIYRGLEGLLRTASEDSEETDEPAPRTDGSPP